MTKIDPPHNYPEHLLRGTNVGGTSARARVMKIAGAGVAAVVLLGAGMLLGSHRTDITAAVAQTISSGNANAQEQPDGGQVQQSQTEIQQQSQTTGRLPAENGNPFVQHLQQAGVSTCSPLVSALGDMLTLGTNYGAQSSWNTETANDRAFQSLVGMTYETEDHKGAAAGVVFAAPNGSALCEGAMVRVVPFEQPCSQIPAMLPQGSNRLEKLGEVESYALGDGGASLMIPSGDTCVVVTVATGTAPGEG